MKKAASDRGFFLLLSPSLREGAGGGCAGYGCIVSPRTLSPTPLPTGEGLDRHPAGEIGFTSNTDAYPELTSPFCNAGTILRLPATICPASSSFSPRPR